jgi:hypothetical protein
VSNNGSAKYAKHAPISIVIKYPALLILTNIKNTKRTYHNKLFFGINPKINPIQNEFAI